jgi:hypothetical protein
MYVIREVVTCKPGKVGQMVDKFKVLSTACATWATNRSAC